MKCCGDSCPRMLLSNLTNALPESLILLLVRALTRSTGKTKSSKMMLFLSTVLALAFASPASSFAIKLSLGVPPLQSQRLSHDIPIHPSVASEDGQVSHQKKLALTAALAAAIVFSTPLAALADGKIAKWPTLLDRRGTQRAPGFAKASIDLFVIYLSNLTRPNQRVQAPTDRLCRQESMRLSRF